MKKKMDAGAIWDAFPPGQTMNREDFVKKVVKLNDPHLLVQDMTKIVGERDRQKTLALWRKNKINKVVGDH